MCFTKALPSATQPPVWERAYAVSKTKRCVEGAAGTRGADKHFAETPLDELTDHTLRLYIVIAFRAAF